MVGHMGIHKTFDSFGIIHGERTIIQASNLKNKIERMGINNEISTIASVGAVAMYPCMKYKLIEQAVKYYAPSLEEEEKDLILSIPYEQYQYHLRQQTPHVRW